MQLAPLYPLLYQILKPTFPNCLWTGTQTPLITANRSKKVALTFDDGPHPRYTPELMAVLSQYKIPASFFWLGVCVSHAPAVAKMVYEQGYWIGLHGYDHRAFPRYSFTGLQQSLEQTQAAIAQACQLDLQNVQAQIRDVRPPNGLFTPQTLSWLHQCGYRCVMWSVVPEDWVRPGVPTVIRRVMNQVQDGSIIVLHDGYFGGQDVAEVALQLIPQLLELGYEFVSVDQFWQEKRTLLAGKSCVTPDCR